MIMQKYKFESPSEITAINIQKNHLNDVYEDDMIHFTNVCQINLTDNEIPLFKLRNFANVMKINLSFNKMKEIQVFPEKEIPQGFPLT